MIVFPNVASEFVALTHYARWLPSEQRRETWEEVINRCVGFLRSYDNISKNVPYRVWKKIMSGMSNFSVMPSMRLVATAGGAAERDNTCLYNCSYLPIDSLESFSELLYILMNGTGVGFSVEKEHISKLPTPHIPHSGILDEYTIEDSREGWAKALLFGLKAWFNGGTVMFDYSKIRPYGAPLKTMGGQASGPDPLREMLNKISDIIKLAAYQNRKLKPIECHDICCHIASNAIMGGKRRSAMISFSDIDDSDLRHAKDFPIPVHRYMANNSAVYKEKPKSAEFMREWSALALSGTGERGMFVTRSGDEERRTNPCGEILLRPYQFCNLSEVVVRSTDDISDLVSKVTTATWIGAIQSTFTNFPHLRGIWKERCEQDRLIGVSLTGQMDNPSIMTDEVLNQLKKVVERTAKHACDKLGINNPLYFTCVKPSGTVSQLVDSSSGCHPRYSEYYIRRYRIAKSDPMFEMVKQQGLPWKVEVDQTADNFTTAVLEFPIKAPKKSVTRKDMSAIDQLNWYLKLQKNWANHNTSITVYVKDDEWLKVGSFVYDNWDKITGVSFLPYDGHKYDLAPYEEIDKTTYNKMVESFPSLDFSKLCEFDKKAGDTTKAAQEFACSGNSCELR